MINLKNKFWILLIIILIVAFVVGFYLFTNNRSYKNNNSDYTTSRSSITDNNTNRIYTENNYSITNENILIENNIAEINTPKTEELISSFSTKIYSKDLARQNNINITCSALNDKIVTNGSTFSFCDTVGKATTDKGYQEADIFDKDGHKEKGLGGGNCQVSTTLYNAVLKIPQLSIVERHEHSNDVPYIEEGKDAAVAYGSYDLKFVNNYGFDIKIKAETTGDAVNINLYKIS